ncbi:MAG: SMI1/KNR4 family protein [Planctomycetota bacterium]
MPGRIQEIWPRLEAVLRQQCPAALESLNPPATPQQIDDLEAKLEIELPQGLRELLLIFNGQPQDGSGQAAPIIPAEHSEAGVYLATWGEFGSVDDIERWTLQTRVIQSETPRQAEQIHDHFREIYRQAGIEPPEFGPGVYTTEHRWLVFCDPGSGDSIGIQVADNSSIPVDSICGINHEEETPHTLAPDLETWFLLLVERYESGRYRVIERDGCLEAVDRQDPETD